MSATIQETIDELRRTLTEYLEATYHIGHPGIVAQRRRLLEAKGGIYQVPYLESTPRYVTGKRYEEMTELPSAAREALIRLSAANDGKPLLFNPPYIHQAEALQETLAHQRNLMIMTGTGSGKTEAFLLPILGKFAIEAKANPASFRDHSATRAIVLYPMNALVNDQLGRLRLLFGSPQVISLFEDWAGRPARFARYTSRTPYAGVRSPKKDSNRLASVGDFFAEIENAARRYERSEARVPEEDERAALLLSKLQKKGKWPGKESVSAWFGKPGTAWRDRNGEYKRAVLQPHDAELLTRSEIQENPPDLLITNYSMLEYMMMRPIERPIFDKTRAWLEAFPDEKILVVLDEAHLYRGAQGAEVGLLLRRLRERLGIDADRFQVICATASFSEEGQRTAGNFGAQLCGASPESFVPITGKLATRSPAGSGSPEDAAALARVDLAQFYSANNEAQVASVREFLACRNVRSTADNGLNLYQALKDYRPLNLLINETMKAALPLEVFKTLIFPGTDSNTADTAVGTLLALASRARLSVDEPSLLPCRIHTFFRGLPGLWVCMDPECAELPENLRGAPAGKLYGQPQERCACGAPVLEFYTCRHCGASYARAYTNDVADPRFIWANSGERLQTGAGLFEALKPLDLLLEEPSTPERGRPATYDLRSGRLNPERVSEKSRVVYLRPDAEVAADEEEEETQARPGEFAPCACCKRRYLFGQSSVQDHQTKGDQPFEALLATQIRIQPPGPQPATEFAPLRGRKVLIFSDSRQMAARLAPTLQAFSLNDTIRALLPVGYRMLALDPQLANSLSLNQSFLAVVIAAHRFGVRVRPELDQSESMPEIRDVPIGQAPSGAQLIPLLTARCPANLMRSIVDAITDNGRGLEPLAIASLRETPNLSSRLAGLPNLPGLAEDEASKLAVTRAWLRSWARGPGVWFGDMPAAWWTNEVRTHGTGEFKAMQRVLATREARRVFKKDWLPRILPMFTERLADGGTRLLARNLSLEIGGAWRRCPTCKSVHRPLPNVTACIDCGAAGVETFDPDTDDVFVARRGFYRAPVAEALNQSEPQFISLIAAEHTAQLNAAQPEDVFSQAEKHEVRFQDIDLAWRDTDAHEPAIDVLSSTTTMEVGIDIGELSGVALRNMPPTRANYQQRAGRAGRRGNAVATVVAFGSSDSHDDHYFVAPDEMIRGPVVDPRLTLENADIARRHLRAYLLQRYHEARIPGIDPQGDPNLFSVLGRVRDFRDGTGVLNRDDFRDWLNENYDELAQSVDRWLPRELDAADRTSLITGMVKDILDAVDEAVGFIPQEDDGPREGEGGEVEDDFDEETEFVDPSADKLLDRLLYWGVLPRYAFPTDVAPFYVFNAALSTGYRPKMEFAPSQGLNIALSQYAPNKQIWIRGKQYTSKAIYSPFRNERRNWWGKRRLYFECSRCGHAKTDDFDETKRNTVMACEACRTQGTFGPAKPWFRPPGFAHPVDKPPVTAPDTPNETAYATRAKLIMPTPAPETGWIKVGKRIRAFPTRKKLLVSNTGPDGEGYNYCVACGRIETPVDAEVNLFQPHSRPYPTDEEGLCPGRVSNHIVLGTDFITDIALFSLPLDAPFQVRPGNDETASSLRTICEAVSKAACRLLQIESGEILAEYRPALTEAGAIGHEAEVFVYDTLAGGAGFSPQLAAIGPRLFQEALVILAGCPASCDTSCYRCLRSYRNKVEHRLLDRKLGGQLLRHALFGGYPDYPVERTRTSLDLLYADIRRHLSDGLSASRNARKRAGPQEITVPIVITRNSGGAEIWLDLSSPVAPDVPVSAELRMLPADTAPKVLCIDDLLIRRNLPAAVQQVQAALL